MCTANSPPDPLIHTTFSLVWNYENQLSTIITNEEAQNITTVPDEDGIVLDEEGLEIQDYE